MQIKFWLVLLMALSLAGCGDNGTGTTGNPPPATYTVSGVISPPLANVTVQLMKGASIVRKVTANAIDGSYSISGVDNGTYTVKPILAAYSFAPVDRTLTINRNLQGVNFTATVIPSGFSISGRITQNLTALPGITMTLTGNASASTVTDASGKYSFTGLATGSYTLTPPTTGPTFTPGSLTLPNINANISNQDFTASSAIVTRNYTLYIQPGTLIINGNGGATLAAWGYTDIDGGLPKFPGPLLSANAGDTVTVTVVNKHSIDHNFVIKGVVTNDNTTIAAGASHTYSFTAASEGSYVYYDTLNNDVNREMGLYGALIVGPADGSQYAWASGPAYDFQRIWVVSEIDNTRWNTVAGIGGSVDTAIYKPNYFLINGQSGSDGMANAATTIDGTVGQTALVRIINAGQFTNSLHFHGNHIQVLTVNGVRQTSPYKELDVINIPPLGTADVLYYLNQIGEYPMHNHIAQMETANGVYLNGIVTMIKMH
jgi:plastocyanin